MKAHYAAGLLTQGLASATNLGLSILAGHAAGPTGLGTVFAGFAAFAAIQGLQRAFVTTPLLASTSAVERAGRERPTSAALTIVIGTAALASLAFLAVGLALGGTLGTGVVLFAPWLVPTLTQQLARPLFFRDGRGQRALLADLAWFAVLLAAAPLVLRTDSEGAVVAAWGLGSVAAAGVALTALRVRLATPREAVRWWREEASAFGSWLAVQETVFIVTGYAIVAVMASVLGSQDLGGFRAAETVFAPISLIAPAILLPGLPAMARVRRRSEEQARRFAMLLSATATGITATYLVFAVLLSNDVLRWVFGEEFAEYDFLVWPMGVWQIAAVTALGFSILLQAEQRGASLLTVGVTGSVSGLVLVSVLTLPFGAAGAAWAYAGGAALSTAATLFFALRRRASS